MLHPPVMPQTFLTKAPMTSLPLGLCETSGWNWTPKMALDSCAMAVKGEVGVEAMVIKWGERGELVAVGHPHLSPWSVFITFESKFANKSCSWFYG